MSGAELGHLSGQRSVGLRGLVVAGADEVGHHGTGLDAAELRRVADQHQARRRPERVKEAGEEWEGDHRRLVDDDQVVRDRVRPVVPEPRAAEGPEERVDRRRRHGPHSDSHALVDQAGRDHVGHAVVHRLLHASGSFAGGRGQGDAGRLAPCLGHEQRGGEDPGDGVGLARARATGHDGHRMDQRPAGGQALEIRLIGRLGREHRFERGIHVRRAQSIDTVGCRRAADDDLFGDGELERPVPLEVEPDSIPHERSERVVVRPIGGRHQEARCKGPRP